MEVETAVLRFTRAALRTLAPTDPARAELARRCGIPLGGPLADAQAQAVWAAAPELSGDADFGLHFAAGARIQDLGIMGYLTQASATVGDGFARVVQFQHLTKSSAAIRLMDEGGEVGVVDGPGDGAPWPRALAEAILATWVIWPRRWAGAACRPLRVSLQHPRPERTEAHEALFGCPVAFGAPVNAAVFSPEVWSLPLQAADPQLVGYLEAAAIEETRRLRQGDPFLEQIERAMIDRLPSGDATVPRIARAVAVSPRSLHRRLRERGLTYQRLLDDLRRRVAQDLLPRHSLAEVAFLVGFSDPSGLRRAFQRWNGAPPAR